MDSAYSRLIPHLAGRTLLLVAMVAGPPRRRLSPSPAILVAGRRTRRLHFWPTPRMQQLRWRRPQLVVGLARSNRSGLIFFPHRKRFSQRSFPSHAHGSTAKKVEVVAVLVPDPSPLLL